MGLRPEKDYVLDLKSVDLPEQKQAKSDSKSLKGRKWVAIRWRCCQVYSRIYKSADGTEYRGNCPKCGKPVSMKVGQGGTDCRFFEAG